MPTIAKPRALLLYLVDKLQMQGSTPITDSLADICAHLQKSGHHIYSLSGNPKDPFLQEDIARDLQEHVSYQYIAVREKGVISITQRGKDYLTGMVPPEGVEVKIRELLPAYRIA